MNQFVAFLRGINVGGRHKVPMAELKKAFLSLGFQNVETILNSGNVIFESDDSNFENLESRLEEHLAQNFKFPIPTIVRSSREIEQLYASNPFSDIRIGEETRLYISFFRKSRSAEYQFPWISPDGSFTILDVKDGIAISVLDLNISGTSEAMKSLEKLMGKEITTRNWKTIEKLIPKLKKVG